MLQLRIWPAQVHLVNCQRHIDGINFLSLVIYLFWEWICVLHRSTSALLICNSKIRLILLYAAAQASWIIFFLLLGILVSVSVSDYLSLQSLCSICTARKLFSSTVTHRLHTIIRAWSLHSFSFCVSLTLLFSSIRVHVICDSSFRYFSSVCSDFRLFLQICFLLLFHKYCTSLLL